jgi:hypothetical protein
MQYIYISLQLGHRKYILVKLTLPIGPSSYFKERARPCYWRPPIFHLCFPTSTLKLPSRGGCSLLGKQQEAH